MTGKVVMARAFSICHFSLIPSKTMPVVTSSSKRRDQSQSCRNQRFCLKGRQFQLYKVRRLKQSNDVCTQQQWFVFSIWLCEKFEYIFVCQRQKIIDVASCSFVRLLKIRVKEKFTLKLTVKEQWRTRITALLFLKPQNSRRGVGG